MKRLAECQNDGEVFVRSVILADDEAEEQLESDARMHEAFGWSVVRLSATEVVCSKTSGPRGGTVRRIWIVDYDPMKEEK